MSSPTLRLIIPVRRLALSLLLVATATLHAEQKLPKLDVFGEVLWPTHPMELYAKYQGGRAPVVAVEKSGPVILVDGTRKTLPESTKLMTQLAPDFSPAQVDADGKIGIGNRKWVQLASGGEATEWRDYIGAVTVRAKTEVPDCFVLITLYDGGAADQPDGADFFKTVLVDVGTIHAGEARTVPLHMGVMMPLRFSNGDPFKKGVEASLTLVFWQVFSQGVEVRTQDLSDIVIRNVKDVYSGKGKTSTTVVTGVGAYIYLRERVGFEDAIDAWKKQNRKADQAARPYAQTPVVAGDVLPPGTVATLSVGTNGKVQDVAFTPGVSPAAAKNLTFCLKLWLYLPALKNGSAQATKIPVPLG